MIRKYWFDKEGKKVSKDKAAIVIIRETNKSGKLIKESHGSVGQSDGKQPAPQPIVVNMSPITLPPITMPPVTVIVEATKAASKRVITMVRDENGDMKQAEVTEVEDGE